MASLWAHGPRGPCAHFLLDPVDLYYIPNHVHFATDGEAVVFMNIRADQYSMLLGEKARAFISLLSRQPGTRPRRIACEELQPQGPARTPEHEVVLELVENRLLTRDNENVTVACEPEIPLPDTELISSIPETHRVSALAFLRFLVACARVTRRLRYCTIENIISGIEQRKKARAENYPMGLTEARRLVGIFMKVSPLFPREFLCLFDSL